MGVVAARPRRHVKDDLDRRRRGELGAVGRRTDRHRRVLREGGGSQAEAGEKTGGKGVADQGLHVFLLVSIESPRFPM
ncbi:hypothetical protein ebA3351 [Aromatoleum aromaticum EbN1]|uniref:Uncharacterized protein n=1 Tax=Aromatoleum aromaticum (strain DSM 19018 / LMG 30748 / EbN1) TaxID=76114 RepID=Q5P3U5_AROAE|nr:hypothetical protein ebA3351 [Aromatoleum aromaticum EbN1]